MNILFFSIPENTNVFAKLIAWLVQISSSIVVGVILFTLFLKLITLPFDYISRASMRKNSLKMEEMRPELEKLQQQYANDKALYQQKMMALYKKNGYSMFGACLPTILTLVIFIVALNGFTSYSQFQNRQYFYNMSKAYNNVVYAGFELDAEQTAYITRNAEEELVFNGKDLYALYLEGQTQVTTTDKNGEQFDIYFDVADGNTNEYSVDGQVVGMQTLKKLYVTTQNAYATALLNFSVIDYADESKQEEIVFSSITYSVIEDKLTDSKLASEENNYLKIRFIDEDGEFLLDDNGNIIEKSFAEAKAENPELTADNFILDIRQQKSADRFHEEQARFLWVKNIWVTDSPLSHPVEENWEEFKSTHDYDAQQGHDIGEEGYLNLTAKLSYEKDAPNGYFILVVLTAGISLLMQIVMSKGQKAQMELQTVDGQGVQTQKIMTIMMPIMMAIFAFMYTSAFSVYIILSNILSMGTTLGINKIVDIKYKKEQAKKEQDTKRIRGRVYNHKQEEKKPEPKKDKKAKPVNENDFLSGKADGKKHVRGRIK